MQQELDPILKKLAEKYNRPLYEIENIVKSPYYLVYKIMDSGDRVNGLFYNIRVRGLGIFKVCDRTVARLEKLKQKLGDRYDPVFDRNLKKRSEQIKQETANKHKKAFNELPDHS